MDPHTVLGVQKDAIREEIDQAFRTKARELHRRGQGDGEAMKQLNDAFNALVGNLPDQSTAEAINVLHDHISRVIERFAKNDPISSLMNRPKLTTEQLFHEIRVSIRNKLTKIRTERENLEFMRTMLVKLQNGPDVSDPALVVDLIAEHIRSIDGALEFTDNSERAHLKSLEILLPAKPHADQKLSLRNTCTTDS